jgi:ATP-dependent Clp protease ATP-binding subunit ClpB
MKQRFRPEFLNRIDEFVTFGSLGLAQLGGIVALELDKVNGRLADKDLSLSATEGVKAWLAEKGFDPVFGARPLKRTIQREVETPLAKLLLANKYPPGTYFVLDAKPDSEAVIIVAKEGAPPTSANEGAAPLLEGGGEKQRL